jgi:hypothetical protein
MFSMLSTACRDEILNAFSNAAVKKVKETLKVETEVLVNSAFDSASLTFGKPLVLPNYKMYDVAEPVAETVPVPVAEPVAVPVPVPQKKVVRIASSFPIAKPTDRYSLAPLADIGRICKEMDEGLFVSNTKCAVWTKGGKHHHMDWDVKRVVMEVKYLQPATSVQIDRALVTMDRNRLTAVLRELRKQGILIVS